MKDGVPSSVLMRIICEDQQANKPVSCVKIYHSNGQLWVGFQAENFQLVTCYSEKLFNSNLQRKGTLKYENWLTMSCNKYKFLL